MRYHYIYDMRHTSYIIAILLLFGLGSLHAQDRTVENRPYTDLRPFHFGVVVGTHLQDIELQNTGPTTYTNEDGVEMPCCVTADQDKWDPGFNVGVVGEFRLSKSFQFRISPSMYFGTRHLTFRNQLETDTQGKPLEQRQELKSAYVSAAFELIFAADRFNNHRPYIMAGINPMLNLTSKNDNYLKLKKTDVFLELGVGCDFYLPFFKLRPELKFMYGLMNSLDGSHASEIRDKNTLPYVLSAKSAHSKMIALCFYFE